MSTEIRIQIGLATVPHYATLQKAKMRIDADTLHDLIGLFVSSAASGRAVIGADATGFDTRHSLHSSCPNCDGTNILRRDGF